MHSDVDLVKQLRDELANFEQIAQYLLPKAGDLPRLPGYRRLRRHAGAERRRSAAITLSTSISSSASISHARIEQRRRKGRIDVVENLRRCQRMAGIALIDVSGHRVTDALLAAMLHQAFLLGAIYELDIFGQITRRLFENLNTRFYQSSGAHKFVSMIYGEISEDAQFRFLSAGAAVPAGLLERARSLHGSERPVRLVPAARHAAVA